MRFHRLRVLRRFPHPGRGFTQGLIVTDGVAWESTGLYGESELRRYRLGAGQPEASAPLPPELFAEGICRAGGAIWQLTWRERTALRWHPDTLELLATVPYNREGWGICEAGEHLLTSDGSGELVRRDPQTLAPLDVVKIRCEGARVSGLNDLAWANGRIWANILLQPCLAGIDPGTGEVTDIVDARSLRERHWGDPQAVLNGIAALPGDGEFMLTGKTWRFIYHVRLVPAGPRAPGRRHRRPADLLSPGG
ncbi:MAG TPA: glutaminyl-peptide cyclotransferase [Streptosporangiaceae bacterium]